MQTGPSTLLKPRLTDIPFLRSNDCSQTQATVTIYNERCNYSDHNVILEERPVFSRRQVNSDVSELLC